MQTTYIKPPDHWLHLDFAELWAYRELVYFLAWRDIKVRYKQTLIGVLWVILQPVLTTVIFTVVFSSVAHFDSPSLSYPLFVFSGLLIWLFINNTVVFASNSLVGSSELVTKVYFPRLSLPLASLIAGLVDISIGFLVFLVLILAYGIPLSAHMIFAPLFIMLAAILAFGVGTICSALNVRFRDIKFALPFGLQIWMFASPIFYPLDILSERAKWAISFNPMTGILSGFRSALFGQEFDWTKIGMSIGITIIVVLFALFVFKRMEDDFADFI
ncbi:MAG: ABC transporter permease [Chloracidobacterium sp.]|nr:ABC transporter permease [Chloracidobacterium sp.]